MSGLDDTPDQSAVAILLMIMLLAAIVLGIFFACLAGYRVKRKQEADRRGKHDN
jgi:hypothetical protein